MSDKVIKSHHREPDSVGGVTKAIASKKTMLPQFFGFTLLEVMVALALLAISFTTLILVQARATNLAIEARVISEATQLARLQLMECKREAQKKIASVGDFKLEGDFADLGFPRFKWECHAPRFNMKPPPASQVEKGLKEKTPDSEKKNTGAMGTISAPFVSMITDALGNSVRELAVIIRWTGENNIEDELRVVTHVIDISAMSALSRTLTEGAKSFVGSSSKEKPESGAQQPSQPGAQQGQMPPGQGGPPPGFPGFRGGPGPGREGQGPPPPMRGGTR